MGISTAITSDFNAPKPIQPAGEEFNILLMLKFIQGHAIRANGYVRLRQAGISLAKGSILNLSPVWPYPLHGEWRDEPGHRFQSWRRKLLRPKGIRCRI